MSQQPIREQWYEAMAQSQAIANWLNCYLREFALPRGQAQLDYRGHDAPAALLRGDGHLLRIGFGQAGHLLCVRIAYASRLGRCSFCSAPYLKSPGQPWRCADARTTVHFLLERLAPDHGFPAHLLAQSENSVAVTVGLLRHAVSAMASGDTLIDAEQSMLWGHALHPTPKSREGVPLDQVLACSPETRSAFALYWFRVDPRLRQHFGRDTGDTLTRLAGADDLYPCHPWEVERVLAHPLLQRARAAGLIEPLGMHGEALWPTSSVRTMYHPRLDYFLKLSIHVRLTNCVRKNAWYELESAVALTELLTPVWRELALQAPGFEILGEPAASTLDFGALSIDTEAVRDLGESFGMLYRETIPALQRERYHPQVAGALFTTDPHGHRVACPGLRHDGTGHALEHWFASYAGLLVDGVLLAFFKYGVVLEPHLQNTVIGFDRGLPTRLWIRDLEGTKLVENAWPQARLATLSERARASVLYTPELGWQRVAYCTLVNNLAEAIFHLADGDAHTEDRLWTIVERALQGFQRRFGSHALLQELLDGADWPCKNNLRTRLLQRADRDSDYTVLPSPLSRAASVRSAA
ncbi:IucA/IucC family protein [Rhodanobacter sp. Col0626]|uniref:IucA/IucC family protein n=1 Tax=Rhodanobacter sp. Col0626 TaxID=3415679 RepID=UPI003CF1C0BE